MLCSCKLADWTIPRPATFSFRFCTRVATLSLCAGDTKKVERRKQVRRCLETRVRARKRKVYYACTWQRRGGRWGDARQGGRTRKNGTASRQRTVVEDHRTVRGKNEPVFAQVSRTAIPRVTCIDKTRNVFFQRRSTLFYSFFFFFSF